MTVNNDHVREAEQLDFMIASQSEIRDRIEQVRLEYDGYKRQLAHLDLSPDRTHRLQTSLRLQEEEMTALETLAQLGRLEPDRAVVEEAARARLAEVRASLAADPALARLSGEERDSVSGEARALLWALGEDRLANVARELERGRPAVDPARTDRQLRDLLMRTLTGGPDSQVRASAAYELGKLHVAAAIPALAAALDSGDNLVAEMALQALSRFEDEELRTAGAGEAVIARAQAVRLG